MGSSRGEVLAADVMVVLDIGGLFLRLRRRPNRKHLAISDGLTLHIFLQFPLGS